MVGLDKITVRVSGFNFPMDQHHLEKIELILNNKVIDETALKEGDMPYAEFDAKDIPLKDLQLIKARAYCNEHGLIE